MDYSKTPFYPDADGLFAAFQTYVTATCNDFFYTPQLNREFIRAAFSNCKAELVLITSEYNANISRKSVMLPDHFMAAAALTHALATKHPKLVLEYPRLEGARAVTRIVPVRGKRIIKKKAVLNGKVFDVYLTYEMLEDGMEQIEIKSDSPQASFDDVRNYYSNYYSNNRNLFSTYTNEYLAINFCISKALQYEKKYLMQSSNFHKSKEKIQFFLPNSKIVRDLCHTIRLKNKYPDVVSDYPFYVLALNLIYRSCYDRYRHVPPDHKNNIIPPRHDKQM